MKFILLISLALALSSCRELVSDEFQEFSPVPTVNSIIIADEPIRVQVSLAEKLDTNRLTHIDNAVVSLYSDGKLVEILSKYGKGLYSSSIIAEPFRTYSCKVNIPGYAEVTCTDSLPSVPYISGIEHINKAGIDEEGLSYPAIRITFKNDPFKRQYFEIVLRLIQKNHEKLATLQAITDPVLLNEGLPLALFSNEYINESSYTMLINYFTGSASASNGSSWQTTLYPLIVELRQVSYNYYQFVKQKYLYELGRYPEFMATSVKPFPLYSNVTGGYGIFAGYSVMKSDTIYPDN
jgi:hypothetical protein